MKLISTGSHEDLKIEFAMNFESSLFCVPVGFIATFPLSSVKCRDAAMKKYNDSISNLKSDFRISVSISIETENIRPCPLMVGSA